MNLKLKNVNMKTLLSQIKKNQHVPPRDMKGIENVIIVTIKKKVNLFLKKDIIWTRGELRNSEGMMWKVNIHTPVSMAVVLQRQK